jgi:mxaJ protein
MKNGHMTGGLVLAILLAGTAQPAEAQRPAPMTPGLLRVCADPDNMPSSNSAGDGFENKLAEMLAKAWSSKLEYTWWAAPFGAARMLNGMYCDVRLQVPAGYDMAGLTKPYFRTSYVIVSRKGSGNEDIKSLDDPRLKHLKIGVNLYQANSENSPPAMALSSHGVVGNLVGYSTVYTGPDHPSDIIKGVMDRAVDVAIVWGPVAGYYAKQMGDSLTLTPLPDDTLSGTPMVFSMAMGTRRRDREFRDSLQKFIDTNRAGITSLLVQYGIPLLPLPADSTGAHGAAAGPPAR